MAVGMAGVAGVAVTAVVAAAAAAAAGEPHPLASPSHPLASPDRSITRYYLRRNRLFDRYERGILLDDESFWSVTPQALAEHHARRLSPVVSAGSRPTVIDAFCGCGGNSLAFARRGCRVICVEILGSRLEMLKHNARVYNIDPEKSLTPVEADFIEMLHQRDPRVWQRARVLFLSPPWGGPGYQREVFDLTQVLEVLKLSDEFLVPESPSSESSTKRVSSSQQKPENQSERRGVAIFLPRTINVTKLRQSVPKGRTWELEKNEVDGHVLGFTLYTGSIVNKNF